VWAQECSTIPTAVHSFVCCICGKNNVAGVPAGIVGCILLGFMFASMCSLMLATVLLQLLQVLGELKRYRQPVKRNPFCLGALFMQQSPTL
jgi:hypothetical protein